MRRTTAQKAIRQTLAEMRSGNGRGNREARPATITKEFPAGSYIIRMDQPYSRIADSLLDYQYWAPDDPQRTPYDDTGWTFGELFNVQVVRVADVKVLDAPVEKVTNVRAPGGVTGTGTIIAINHNADPALATLRYRFKNADIQAAEDSFEAGGHKFNRGSFLVRGVSDSDLQSALTELGIRGYAIDAVPSEVKTHPLARRARRFAAHMAKHADRRLVARSSRRFENSVRLHQHANCFAHSRSEREVRRDPISSNRRWRKSHRHH